MWLLWQNGCLVCMRPWVSSPALNELALYTSVIPSLRRIEAGWLGVQGYLELLSEFSSAKLGLHEPVSNMSKKMKNKTKQKSQLSLGLRL